MSAGAQAVGQAEWRPSVNPWIIAASVMSATFMEVLDTSVANVALPHIAGSLSASTDESTWVLTSYLVSNAIVLPATGWLSSVFGRKRFLIICIIIFTIASGMCGAATSLPMLIVARILQGVGGGALQPIAQAVMLESFPPERRGSAMAVYGMGVVVAPIIGPTLGGWITDNYSWRWVFYINLPVGILAVMMSNLFLEDPPYIKNAVVKSIDYIGFGLMAIGLAAFEIVLDKGQQEDWFASPLVVGLSVVAVVTIVSFIVWELSVESPIVDVRIFKNRNFAVGATLMAVVGAVLYGTTALLPLFLQTLLGYPAVQSGMTVSPRGIGSMLSMIIVGRLVAKLDGRWLIVFGFVVLAYSTFELGNINLEIASSNVMWPSIISGFAMGFIFVPLTTVTMGTLKNEQLGNATGVYSLMRNQGGSVGIASVTTFLARLGQQHQSYLVAHATPYSEPFREKMAQLTAALGSEQAALGAIYGQVRQQATLLAFVDIFRWLALLCLCCVPLVFIFKKVRGRGGAVAAH